MVKQAVEERRHTIRAKQILSIQFRLVKRSRKNIDKSWGLSTTQDVSLEGISFYTDREFCINDILEIHVIMSGFLDVYKGYGKVVRMERKKSGVCYLVAVQCIEKEQINKDNKIHHRSIKKLRTKRRL